MSKRLLKPWIYTVGIAILILIYGMYSMEKTLDINIGDTYYVMRVEHYAIFTSEILFAEAIIYFFWSSLKFNIWKPLMLAHIFLSTVGFFIPIGMLGMQPENPVFYTNANFYGNAFNQLIVIGLAQLAFLINLVVGIFRKTADNRN